MSRNDEEFEVIVVGAGLVGLAAAAFLAQQGVRVLAVDRHPATSTHPKARLVTVRSMEIYRALGVEEEVRTAGEPNSGFDIVDTLAGTLQSWIAAPAEEVAGDGLSPTTPYSCDQHRLEPILLRRARELGATVEFGTSAELADAGSDDVTVKLSNGEHAWTVRSQFLVAADGARSAVRDRLGITLHGEDVEGESVSSVFRADLEPALRGRHINAVMCRAANAFLFARGNEDDRSWQLGTFLRPGWAELAPAELATRLIDVLRLATGLPDLRPVIEDTARWRTGAYVADRFRHGRVFLAGDAAHVMPPYGGFGGNTGVQDAHNLAWKLAAACRREDDAEALLASYETERRPVAELMVAQALLRSRKKPGQAPPPGEIDATTLFLGFRYGGQPEDPANPSGLPGTRAPHVLLRDGRSTLDLLRPTSFTVVDAEAIGPLVDPVHRARWDATYGRGLVVRPDGIIGRP